MKKFITQVCIAISFLLFATVQSSAQERGFGAVKTNENSIPKSTSLITDPTGSAPTQEVRIFRITPNYCSRKNGDCDYKSVRSEREQISRHEPKERWYGWYFYLPKEFPVGKEQTVNGQYIIGQWKSDQCPHLAFSHIPWKDNNLYFQTTTWSREAGCGKDTLISLGDMRNLRGKWHRIEMFVRWAKTDGIAVVYLDGKKVVDYKGRTLLKGLEDKIWFKYGIYHCCTDGLENIKPYQMYYTLVRSAKTREGLQ